MTNERYITWEEVTRGCLSLVMRTSVALDKSEIVVAMSDDTITASIISNLIDLPFVAVNVSPMATRSHNKPVDICHPILSGGGVAPILPKLIIVSSQITTADKVEELAEAYQKRGHEINVLTLFDGSDCGYRPNYSWQRSDSGTHLIFPWEI